MPEDITGGAFTVKGLRQAAENLATLNGALKLKIGRAASLAGALVINEAVKGATYTTFKRQTGAIRSGFGVRVGHELNGTMLNSVVVEYPQNVIGSNPMTALFRKHFTSSKSRARSFSIDPRVAYWWRFLEFGTGPRRTSRRPTFLRKGRVAETPRDYRALGKYQRASSTGQIMSRAWVRPAFGSSAQRAIYAFRDAFQQQIETEVNQLPK